MLGKITTSAFFFLLLTATTIPALPLPAAPQQYEGRSSTSPSVPMMRRNGRRFTTPMVKRDIINKFITNAQRLSNGLAPLPPSWKTFKGKRGLKRRQNGPSPTVPAPQPTVTTITSPSFEQHTGYFSLRNGTGGSAGYLDRTAKRFGLVRNNDTASEALRVRFWMRSGYTNTSYATVTMENWVSESGGSDEFPLLGLINGEPDNNGTQSGGDAQELSSRENHKKDADGPVILFLGGIEIPADRSITTPQNLNNSISHSTGISSKSEPNVWSIDIASGNVIAQWTDAHGHRIPTQVVLVNDTLVATNNLTYLGSALTEYDQVTAVTLHFITGFE